MDKCAVFDGVVSSARSSSAGESSVAMFMSQSFVHVVRGSRSRERYTSGAGTDQALPIVLADILRPFRSRAPLWSLSRRGPGVGEGAEAPCVAASTTSVVVGQRQRHSFRGCSWRVEQETSVSHTSNTAPLVDQPEKRRLRECGAFGSLLIEAGRPP